MPKSSRYQGRQNLPLDKSSSKEIYSILISNIVNKPTLNIYFKKLFENTTLDWNKIYLSIQQLLTLLCVLFNIKFLVGYFFLTKNYTLLEYNTTLCSFGNTLEETPTHIFFDCIHVKCLWKRLQMKFQNDFILPSLKPQTAILGLYNEENDNYNLLSHILLTF